jgi:hypothetical protein
MWVFPKVGSDRLLVASAVILAALTIAIAVLGVLAM